MKLHKKYKTKSIYSILLLSYLYSCGYDGPNEASPVSKTQVIKEEPKVIIEKFKVIDISKFNDILSRKEGDLTPTDIMNIYYPYKVESREGNEKISISEKVLDNGNVEVKLIHNNLLDDSVRAEKYIMELERYTDNWIVVSLKKNWKCWRGNSGWNIVVCN